MGGAGRGVYNLFLRAFSNAARRGGGSPSLRRCGGTSSSAALSRFLSGNALDGAIPTEFGRLTELSDL